MSYDAARIVLVGDGPTADSALETLIGPFETVGVIRNLPSDQSGSDPVVARASERGIEVFAAPTPRELESVLRDLDPDLVVVSSYARILPAELVARWPFVNVHYAPLPAYRGRANVNWALINGEREVAITVHSIVPGLDSGPILIQAKVPIGSRDTVTDLYQILNELQGRILPEAVRMRLAGELGTPQDEHGASYCCGRVPDDGLIDWSCGTDQVDRLIRALTAPYPGAFTFLDATRVVVDRARPLPDAPNFVGRIAGRVVRVHRDSGEVDVLTGDGVLRLESVRVDGELHRPADVIRSVRDTLGLTPLTLMKAAGLIA